jgi:hypothetical protein
MNWLLDPWIWHWGIVPKRQFTFRNIPEVGRSILYLGGSLKSRNFCIFLFNDALLNGIIQHQIRRCHCIVNWLRTWMEAAAAWCKMEQIVKTRECHRDSQWRVSNRAPPKCKSAALALSLFHWRHFCLPSEWRSMHCLRCLCVDVKDEHRNATCSRASCDCSRLTGV